MKLSSSLLALLAFALPVLSAKKKEDYDSFRVKSRSTPALKLNDASFQRLTVTPRNHSTAVLLTALEGRFGCKLCQDFQPEWQILANSWVRGDKADESRLLFGTLDFADGKQTFQGLQLQTAPVLMLYPPTTGPQAKSDPGPIRYDFTSGPVSADSVRTFLVRQLPDGPHPAVYRPFNYVRFISLTTIALGSITAVFVLYPYLWPLLSNRNLWAGLSIIAVLLFTSGHMFNHIRGTPYVSGDGKGGIQYFTGGFQNQLGLESQIVAALYALLSFATVSLALKVPRMADARGQQAAVLIWAAVMYGTYSFLLSVFRLKNGGYPFRLPPF